MSQSRVLLGVKLALAVMVVIAYLAFCLLALLAGLDSPTPIEVIRHAIFVTGLVPLCAWLRVIFVLSVKGDENVSARDDYHVVSLRAFCSVSPLGWLFILGAQLGEFALSWGRSVRRKTRMFCLS